MYGWLIDIYYYCETVANLNEHDIYVHLIHQHKISSSNFLNTILYMMFRVVLQPTIEMTMLGLQAIRYLSHMLFCTSEPCANVMLCFRVAKRLQTVRTVRLLLVTLLLVVILAILLGLNRIIWLPRCFISRWIFFFSWSYQMDTWILAKGEGISWVGYPTVSYEGRLDYLIFFKNSIENGIETSSHKHFTLMSVVFSPGCNKRFYQ